MIFNFKQVYVLLTFTLLECILHVTGQLESSDELLNTYLDEIREVNARETLIRLTKAELNQIKAKIDRMVLEIERTRQERYNPEELFWNSEKRQENDLLRLAKRRLKKNRSKIDELERNIDEIKYSNSALFMITRDRILESYNAAFVDSYPKFGDNLNRILVKRKVPKGIDSPKFEYDSALKTLYRPLIRLENAEANEEPTGKDYKPYVDSAPLRSRETYVSKLVKDIKRLLRIGEKNSNGKEAPKKLKTILRQKDHHPIEFSFETFDPLAPGKSSYTDMLKLHHQLPETTTKPPFWLPEYSLYNYWTVSIKSKN